MSRLSSRAFVMVSSCMALALGAACTKRSEPEIDLGRDARIPPSSDLGARDFGADLANVDLGSSDLGSQDLGATDLGAADLGGSDLGGTDLGGSDLGGSDLGGSDLGRSDLGGSDLGSVDLGASADLGTGGGYRHTITIDGVNDFDVARDQLATTTAGYSAYLSWDDAALYFGIAGADIAGGSATKWVLVYLDTNGPGSGTAVGQRYRTQTPTLPPGLVADFYFRWRTDNLLTSVQRWDATSSMWVDTAIVATTYQSGTFVEMRIALADLSSPGSIGVAALMINEADLAEYSYAGVPTGTFSDGYYANIPMTRWVSADRSLATNPNDAARRRP